MNIRAMKAIARKDLKVVSQSKGIMVPLIVVPVLLFLFIPALVALLMPYLMQLPGSNFTGVEQLISYLPAGLASELAGYEGMQVILAYVLIYMFAPLFLVVPMMVASVIAADSFAGEKERKTLEALLYTPTSDRELFTGKLLSSFIPAVIVSLVGFVLYILVVNGASWPVMGRIFFPNLMWVLMVLWVAPAVAGLALTAMVLVSKRVSGFQEAYQLGSLVILPILALLYAQIGGLMYFSILAVLLIGLLVWAVDAALLWYGVKSFQRGEIIARL